VGPGLRVVNDRYDGKPFLRLLECYVLWSIDRLPMEYSEQLEEMTPRLAATYGADGTWQEIVAAQMEFPPGLPDALRGMWERTLANADEQQGEIDSQFWAQQVVDSNFV
jgi:hypothetical protein